MKNITKNICANPVNQRPTYLYFVICIVFILLLAGCGAYGTNESTGEGSIAFSVEWQGAPNESSEFRVGSSELRTASIDCAAIGVSTVEAYVYDENNSYLAGGGPWDCNAGQGTITGVKAGSNRKVVILAKDSSGNVLYRGEKTGITVTAGSTTSTGTIIAEIFVPTLLTPANDSVVINGTFSFLWASVTGAAEYRIQVSTDSSFSTKTINTATTNTIHTPLELSYGATFYWRVRATDSYGNISAWSDVFSLTISTAPGQPPSAPIGLTATAGDGQVTISWGDVSGATTYVIYMDTSSGVSKTNYTDAGTASITSYTWTGLANGITYYFVVTAVNSYGESDESSEVDATPNAAPSAPTGVSATVGDGEVTISWDSVSGTTSYNIYMGISSGVSKTNYTDVATVTTTSYTWTGLTNGTIYYFVVTAENSYGESDESAEVSATPGTVPPAPLNVSATAGDGQVTLSWDSVSEATSYNIYMDTSPGVSKTNYTDVGTTSTTSYIWTGLTNGTPYYFVVTTVNDYGESNESTEVITTPGTAPPTPTGITTTAGDGQVTISWDSVSDATSYNIYMDTSSGVSKTYYTATINTTLTSYTWTGLTNGTTYYFVVTAENSYGESNESTEVSATPTVDTTAPTILSVSPGSGDTGVPVSTTITVGFNESIDPSTLNSNTFTLEQGGNTISGTITYNDTTKTATFTPSSALSSYDSTYGTTYDVTITTGVNDLAGNPLNNEYRWSFTTATISTVSSLTTLSLNTSATGELSSDQDYNYYQITVLAGQHLYIFLDGNTLDSSDQNDLYVKYGSLPSTSDYDYSATLIQPDQSLDIADTLAGDYYIMVYGDYYWGGGPNFYTLNVFY